MENKENETQENVETQENETQETQETKKENEIGWQVFASQPRYCNFTNGNKKENCNMYDVETKTQKHFQFLSRWYCGRLASKISFLQEMIENQEIAPDSIVYVYANGNQCEITLENKEKYIASSTGNIFVKTIPQKNNLVQDYAMKNNIVLVYDKNTNTIYTNKHNENKKKYQDAINFLQTETGATIKSGCDFPFVIETKNGNGEKIKQTDSLETVLKKAVANDDEIEM